MHLSLHLSKRAQVSMQLSSSLQVESRQLSLVAILEQPVVLGASCYALLQAYNCSIILRLEQEACMHQVAPISGGGCRNGGC